MTSYGMQTQIFFIYKKYAKEIYHCFCFPQVTTIVGTEQIIVDYLTADGKTYQITVTFDEKEELSADMELVVSEIPEGSYSYNDYLEKTAQAMWLDSAEDIAEARFFDIEIQKDGSKYEPVYPTTVNIQYQEGFEVGSDDVVNIVHFTDGKEIELISDVEVSNGGTELTYQQDSFSVTGSVLVRPSGTDIFDTAVMIVAYNNKYYAVDSDLNLHEVTLTSTSGNTTFTFVEEDLKTATNTDVDKLAPFLWGKSNATNGGNSTPGIISAKGEYLQLYPASSYNGDSSTYPTTKVVTRKTDLGQVVLDSSNHLYQKVSNSGSNKWPDSQYTGGDRTYGMRVAEVDGKLTLMSYGISASGSDNGRCTVYFVKPDTPSEGEHGSDGHGSSSEDELGAPATSKTLKNNNDGTYELALSVTGKSKGATDSAAGDVMLIMDTSNSMRDADMNTAKAAAVTFGEELMVKSGNMKLALETYNKTASWPGIHKGFTSSKEYYDAVVNTTLASQIGDTNWQDAFDDAYTFYDTYSTNGAPRYIVFMSDGKPNAYGSGGTVDSYTCLIYKDFETADEVDNNFSSSDKSISNTNPTSLSNAVTSAQKLMNAYSGTKIFFVTTTHEGDNTGYDYRATKYYMQKLAKSVYGSNETAAKYFFEANQGNLEDILAQIATEISKDYTYQNVTITDGVTSGSVGTGVNGSVGNFTYEIAKYDSDGNVISGTEATVTVNDDNTLTVAFPAIGTDGEDGYIPASTETITGATFTNGSVSWEMGSHKLHDGYTYTVKFTVWPSQAAYDAITDIKNGKKTYEEVITDDPTLPNTLTEDGKYVTNTTASVSYESWVTKSDGTSSKVGGGTIKLKNPAPEDLSSAEVTVRKDWISNMVPDWELESPIYLGMNRSTSSGWEEWLEWDDTNTRIIVSAPDWTATRYIAPGILISETQAAKTGINTTNLTKVTYRDSEYYQLNAGHSYKFTEGKNKNFELEDETYVPMLVDGKMQIRTGSGTDEDPYVYTEVPADKVAELVASNYMRGGINIYKVVQDSDGNVIEPTDASFTDSFTMHVKITAPDGEVDQFDTTSISGKTVVWYDVYDINGQKIAKYDDGTNYLEFNTTTGIAEGDLPAIKNGESIRITNVVTGSIYEVTEVGDNASAYEKTYKYEYIEYDEPVDGQAQPKAVVENSDKVVGQDRQNNVTVTNKMLTSDMVIIKTDDEWNAITSTDDTAVFKLLRNTKSDGKGSWTNAEAASGVASDGTVTVNTTAGIKIEGLKDGLYQLKETKSPGGYIISNGTVYFKLGGGKIQFVSVENDGTADAAVTNIETPTGYSVVNKTTTTPVTLKVANTPGKELPQTGGPGTFLYTLSGMMLIAISALMYGFRMRRRERRYH